MDFCFHDIQLFSLIICFGALVICLRHPTPPGGGQTRGDLTFWKFSTLEHNLLVKTPGGRGEIGEDARFVLNFIALCKTSHSVVNHYILTMKPNKTKHPCKLKCL